MKKKQAVPWTVETKKTILKFTVAHKFDVNKFGWLFRRNSLTIFGTLFVQRANQNSRYIYFSTMMATELNLTHSIDTTTTAATVCFCSFRAPSFPPFRWLSAEHNGMADMRCSVFFIFFIFGHLCLCALRRNENGWMVWYPWYSDAML